MMKRGNKMIKWHLWILSVFILAILLFFLFRVVSPREIDDVTPGIPCEEEYLKKSDVIIFVTF